MKGEEVVLSRPEMGFSCFYPNMDQRALQRAAMKQEGALARSPTPRREKSQL